MFCRYCGNELPQNVKFCVKCGKPTEPDSVLKTVETKDDENTLTPREQKEIARVYRKALLRVLLVLFAIVAVLFIVIYIK